MFPCYTTGYSPDRNRTYITSKVGLRCHTTSTPRPFCFGLFVYVFTLHQTAFQPSKVVRPLCGSGSRNFKTSHRCPIINKFPPLPVPALSLLDAGRLIAFGADQPTRIIYGAQAAFSDFRGRDVYRRPNLSYCTPRLFSLPSIAT